MPPFKEQFLESDGAMETPAAREEANVRMLRLACACASASPVAGDPWVAIVKQGKLVDGTKERILNALHAQPRTVTKLAQSLGLAPPTVHRHVAELLASELVKEAPVPPENRRSAVERHYRPAFPVVTAEERQELQPTLDELASAFADVFRAQREALAEAFAQTSLPARGFAFDSLAHCLFTTAIRLARAQLEMDGSLPPWPEHADGSRWVWWAEEPPEADNRTTEAAD
jgi:DNA-binding transcriptional ArsR family regulator